MKIVFTLDFLRLGLLGIFIIVALICLLIAVIDVFTKDWRYRKFKCPKCGHMYNGHCGHFRNSKCDCDYYYKRSNK